MKMTCNHYYIRKGWEEKNFMKIFFSSITALLILALLFIAPAIAGEGDDEVEPNDTMDLADPVDGYIINGHMDEDDVEDWFVLDGQEGYEPTFTIYFDEDECEIDFEIYSDDELVESVIGYGTEESITCEVPGDCYIHVYYWDGEGEYTIEIDP